METPINPLEEARSSCEQRLEELSHADITDLQYYAERRHARVGISPELAKDIVQDALLSVIRGIESANEGRRPRPTDITTKEAFHHYLKGVINSKVEARTRQRQYRATHLPAEELLGENDSSGVVFTATGPEASNAERAGLLDITTEFFGRMRQRAPGRLLPAIEAWEQLGVEADRIPARGRTYMDVKHLAQEVCSELGLIQ